LSIVSRPSVFSEDSAADVMSAVTLELSDLLTSIPFSFSSKLVSVSW
jgi:hypothetical protein